MDPLWRENPIAKWRRDNGVVRVDGVLRDTRVLPHPRLGGARGYDIPFYQMIVDAYRAGNPPPPRGNEGQCLPMDAECRVEWGQPDSSMVFCYLW